MAWVVAFLVLGVVIAVVWASADVGSGVYVKSLCRATTDERKVAITFDDGPDPEVTPWVLDVLKRHGAKATFFVVGSRVKAEPELLKRILREGHTVGSHTFHHAPISTLWSTKRYTEELFWSCDVVARLTGLRMRLFRPPFGVTNPMIGRAVRSLGLQSIGWSVRSLDTLRFRTREAVLSGIMRRVKPGAVILLHDRLEGADRLLDELLSALETKHYTAVTVDELFETDAYEA